MSDDDLEIFEAARPGGGLGAILTQDGAPTLTVSFAFAEDGRICDVYITRNPDKLGRLEPVVIH